MSEQIMDSSGDQVRTLAVRLTDSLRAQLDGIARINGRTTTEEIRAALEDWIDKAKADPTLAAKAKRLQAEIEREAKLKSEAIASLLGDIAAADEEQDDAPAARPTSRRKAAGE